MNENETPPAEPAKPESLPSPPAPPAAPTETPAPPPAATEVLAGKVTEQTADLERKLQAREKELREREAKLADKEASLQRRRSAEADKAERQKRNFLSGGNALFN